MDETYGTYVDDECFDIHDYGDDTDHDTNDDTDDDTDDDTNDDIDDTDDGGRGDRRPLPGGAVHFSSPPRSTPLRGGAYKFPGFGSRLGEGKGEGKQRCSNTLQDPWRGRRIPFEQGLQAEYSCGASHCLRLLPRAKSGTT